VIVDCAVYVEGKRRESQVSLAAAVAAAHLHEGFVWVGMHEPTAVEFEDVALQFSLHPLAVEDAIHAHQRPKLEQYDDTLFVVLRSAAYHDAPEVVEIGEILMFLGDGFVVTVRHGHTRALHKVRLRLEQTPDLLRHGPGAVFYAVLDRVVDDYGFVLDALDHDVDQIEDRVFTADRSNHAERIYRLKREVLEFKRAVLPLAEPVHRLVTTPVQCVAAGLQEYFRDVHDHLLRDGERVESVDALLNAALEANHSQVGVQQNEDMRKISAWVAIAAVPTMMAGIYGMNFENMPELHWRYSYFVVVAVMITVCLGLYRAFRRNDWL
jgi:magnesium transporter